MEGGMNRPKNHTHSNKVILRYLYRQFKIFFFTIDEQTGGAAKCFLLDNTWL